MLKKVCDGISTAIIILLVLTVAALFGCNLFGVKAYSVLSGSMAPTYGTGSLVYVRTMSADTMETGDVITFRLENGTVATHRLVSKDEGSRTVVTKGDANPRDDGATPYERVIGKVIFGIPLMGYAAVFLSTVSGKIAIGCLFLVALVLMLLPELIGKKKKQSEDA